MDNIEVILKNTTEENQSQVDWTKVWSGRYPVLKTYQTEVDIPYFEAKIRELLHLLREQHGYSDVDAMLVLKDILAHSYKE